MSDLADVEAAIVGVITTAIYPAGSQFPSTVGAPTRIYRGWPNASALDVDILAGVVNVSVFADPGMTRVTSRYPVEARQVAVVAPTIVAAVSGATVTLSGTITAGNVVGIQAGSPLAAYATRVLAGDTLTTVAARLAAKISGATSLVAVITLPSRLNLVVGTMTAQSIASEVRRQDQGFRVSVWCGTPTLRDTTAGLIDQAFAGLKNTSGNITRFVPLPNGEHGWIRYLRTYVTDTPTKANLWRRDLCYMVEYPTTLIEQDPVMLFGGGTLNGSTQLGALPPS